MRVGIYGINAQSSPLRESFLKCHIYACALGAVFMLCEFITIGTF